MYKKFFGLADNPFNIVPDPRYLFTTQETDEAFANLAFGVRAHKGIILLAGEVGTGKTILLKKLVDHLQRESVATAFIFNPRLNPTEFFDYVLSDFGVAHDAREKSRMLRTLHAWLLDRHRVSQTTVLIVDEAHDMPPEVFEEVRLLSNLETPTDKLVQIILSGQPEIEEKLAEPRLRQFRQRIALRCRISALSPQGTERYIAHRVRVAGGDPAQVFSADARTEVFEFSQGIPRVINLICEQALIAAYADQQKPISANTVAQVAAEFRLVQGAPILSASFAAPFEELESLSPFEENSPAESSPAPARERAPMPASAARPPDAQESTGLPTEPPRPSSASKPVEIDSLSPAGAPADVKVSEIRARERTAPVAESAERANPLPGAAGKETDAKDLSAITRARAAVPPQPSPGTPHRDPAHVSSVPGTASPPERKTDSASATFVAPVSASARLAAPEVTVPSSPAKAVHPTNATFGPAVERRRYTARSGPALPPFLQTDPRGTDSRKNSASALWAILVMLAAAAVMGGYYIAARNPAVIQIVRSVFHSSIPPAPESKPGKPGPQAGPTRDGTEEALRSSAAPQASAQTATGISEHQQAGSGRVTGQVPPEPFSPSARPVPRNVEKGRAQVLPPPTVNRNLSADSAQLPGQILVISDVAGAEAGLDGESNPAWVTPHTFTNLRPGAHVLSLSKRGYVEIQQTVNVESGRVMIVSATMVTSGPR